MSSLTPLQWVLVVVGVFVLCGIYDVSRNTDLSSKTKTIKRYFLGNGILTWFLSPFNTLLDILCLPYINKGIYRPEDLPPGYQQEIKQLIDSAHSADLVGQLQTKVAGQSRSMIFFKWYGSNIETSVDVPDFHKSYKYIRTIGVSVFNKKQKTSIHYGPFRATLRLLYNVNDVEGKAAYIIVGKTTHYWSDNKLFIFDDTLQHQSVNDSETPRYCLFVDILRPSPFAFLFSGIVDGVRFFLKSVNFIFYKNWKVIR